jgi:hypothetical protein
MMPFNVPTGFWRFWTDNLIESSERQVAGMLAAAQAALLQRLTAALSKSVAAAKGGKRVRSVQSIIETENICALSVRPSQHMMAEAFLIMLPAMFALLQQI